jgi:hypothetical protein
MKTGVKLWKEDAAMSSGANIFFDLIALIKKIWLFVSACAPRKGYPLRCRPRKSLSHPGKMHRYDASKKACRCGRAGR